MYVKFTRIRYLDVLADIRTRGLDSQNHDSSGSGPRFNSAFHTRNEAPDSTIPSEYPYSFKRWLPLILRSRGLSPSDAQVVKLSSTKAHLLLKVASESIPAGYVNRLYQEEIQEEIMPAFDNLRFPPEGLFMRLDACSAKDSVQTVPGDASLHSVEDIILQLVTSQRARDALFNALLPSQKKSAFDLEKTGLEPFELFFLPFNHRMQTAREYRVFCPPIWHATSSTSTPISHTHISAISQYQWHKPWLFATKTEDECEKLAEKIARGCKKILGEIIHEADLRNLMDNGLFWQGFTFDVCFDEQSDTFELVELNVFGCRSACGSCLFHWKDDKLVLHNRNRDKIEFRATF
ncbi:hypothetical protein F4776DRAFT_322272 [Hypoxylon sp. NC0597]|nr:hypothetical protein F4776DRAFT_322272 [Hypoxylon sp. NC0597]